MKENTRQEYNDFIVKTVDTLREQGKFSWNKVHKEVKKAYPEMTKTQEQVRSAYRYTVNQGNYKINKIEEAATEVIKENGITDKVRPKLLHFIRRKQEVHNLANRLGITYAELLTEITKLELEGFTLTKWKENGKPFIKIDTDKRFLREEDNVLNLEATDQIKLLVISDTHIGHKNSEINFMQKVVVDAYDKGVRQVLHVGDVTEGHYQSIRPTSIRELDAVGFDEQLELAELVFPELEDMRYYSISGNHDGTFDRNAFANPVKTLAKIRKDWTYLGHNFAKVTVNDIFDIVLVHPTDGIGQNYALKLKQYIDRNQGDRIGRFIFMGHYHKFAHLHSRGIDAWVMPSLIGQTEFMRDKNLENIVGAILLTINLNEDGEITTFTPEYYFKD